MSDSIRIDNGTGRYMATDWAQFFTETTSGQADNISQEEFSRWVELAQRNLTGQE